MSGACPIVGVDVGGTFTDLFCFDEATRTFAHRQGAVARAATRRVGFLERACARSAASRRSAPSCTAPRSAPTRCWSARARSIGVITTRGFRDVLEMRRRDRPPHLGPVGRLHADRRPRHAARGRRAHAGRRHDPRRAVDADEVRAAARALLAQGRAGGRDHLHQRLRQRRERARARSTAVRDGLAQRLRHRLARGAARDPRVRALLHRRRSTPICSRSSAPISASSKPRSRRQSFAASSTSCSRTAASCRPRPRASCRCAPRCPARRPA